MPLQLVLVLLAIAGAALYVGRKTWRSWSGNCSGCSGKSSAPAPIRLIPVEHVTLRRR